MSTLAHTVTRSVLIEAPAAEVWESITDEAALSERRGEVELVEEAERLAFHWWREGFGPSQVELIVDAVAEGTRLTVVETQARRDDLSSQGRQIGPSAEMLGAGWESSLGSLRLSLGRLVLA